MQKEVRQGMCGLVKHRFPWPSGMGRKMPLPRAMSCSRGAPGAEPSLQPCCPCDPGVVTAPWTWTEGNSLLQCLAPADAGQGMGTEKGSLGAAACPSCGGGDQPDPKCYISLERQFCCILDSVKGIQFRKHYARERRRRAKHYG